MVWGILGTFGDPLGCCGGFWGTLGMLWGHFEDVLGTLGTLMGTLWGCFRALWGCFRALWGDALGTLREVSGTLRGHFGGCFRDILGTLRDTLGLSPMTGIRVMVLRPATAFSMFSGISSLGRKGRITLWGHRDGVGGHGEGDIWGDPGRGGGSHVNDEHGAAPVAVPGQVLQVPGVGRGHLQVVHHVQLVLEKPQNVSGGTPRTPPPPLWDGFGVFGVPRTCISLTVSAAFSPSTRTFMGSR